MTVFGKKFVLSALACVLMGAGALGMEFRQAPILDAKVADGTLPPVQERLPENPYVEKVTDGIGKDRKSVV